ncbi:MAG: PqqD family protein [Alphaproteobacteria bacterium]|nr:PqqD family protein [Alphaproteobacteria bacterium]
MMQSNIKLVLSPKVITRKQDGKFYLYNRDTENVLELNSIGMEIVEKLQTKISSEELAIYFSNKYNISVDEVITDIKDFIEACIDKKFLLQVENEDS